MCTAGVQRNAGSACAMKGGMVAGSLGK